MNSEKKAYTLSILVEDTPGVLSQVAPAAPEPRGSRWLQSVTRRRSISSPHS